MTIGDDTYAHRRHLPHLEKTGKTYFVTFSTRERETITPSARDIVLNTVVFEHRRNLFLHTVTVMPDHTHIVFTPHDSISLSGILKTIKSVSSHQINKALGRHGSLWEEESFDRILRSDEDLRKKCEYVCNNPVRAGLCETADDWPWTWREWVEGRR